MLIYLRHTRTGHTLYLLQKDTFLIGRRDCDLYINNDKSISKHHAKITIKDDSVFLEDLGSTYKTKVNDETVTPTIKVPLKRGDEIKFGVFHSIYRLEVCDYTVCCSGLNGPDKTKLKENLSRLGVRYSADWTPECTHLTVVEVSLTIKFLLALLDERPIVRSEFWERFVESVDGSTEPPKVEDYKNPPIAEPLLKKINMEANPMRRRLFEGKTFLFFSEKIRRQMEEVISKAGGSSISWERDKPDIADLIERVVVIQVSASTDDAFASKVKPYLDSGRRLVSFDEIAHAIVNCSCDRYCNPSFQLGRKVFCERGPGAPTQVEGAAPLAGETPDGDLVVERDRCESQKFVPETVDPEMKSEDEVDSERPVKRMRIADEESHRQEPSTSSADATTSFTKSQSQSALFKKLPSNQITASKKPPPVSLKRKNEDSSEAPFAFFFKKPKNQPERKEIKETPRVRPERIDTRPSHSFSTPESTQPTTRSNPEPRCSTPKSTQPPTHASNGTLDTTDRSRDVSNNQSGVVSNGLDETWFTKTSTSIKAEKSFDDCDLDEETKNFIRNMSMVLKISDDSDCTRSVESRRASTQDQSACAVRNFKKFKKVKPLNAQHTVIERGNLMLASSV